MATRTDAPTGRSLIDELASVTADDDDEIAGAVPAEPEAGATPPTDAEAPAEEPVGQEAEPDGAEEPAPDAPPEPVAYQPPEGGQPFTFRADGRDFAVPGALRYDHGLYIPTAAWDTVQKQLADREAITAQIRQRDARIAELNPEHNPVVLQNQAALAAFNELLQKTPQEMAEWLDNYEINKPLLLAKVQNEALTAQLNLQKQQGSQQEFEQRSRAVAAELPGYLQKHIDYLVDTDPELKDLKGGAEQLVAAYWPLRQQLFVEAPDDRGLPEYGLGPGQIGVNREALRFLLSRDAAARAEKSKLETAAAFNRKANGQFKPAPTVAARGRPTPGGRSKTYKPGDPASVRDWKADFMSDTSEE